MASKNGEPKSAPADKKDSTGIVLTIIVIGVIAALGFFFITMKKGLTKIELKANHAQISSNSAKDEVRELLSFVKQNSENGEVYENLAQNNILKGKDLKSTLKVPTYLICGDDEQSTVIKFHPSGYFMLWSETKDNLKLVDDHTKAETAYFKISGDELTLLLFDKGSSYTEKAKVLKTDKNKVVTQLSFSQTSFSRDNCHADLLLTN